MQVYFTYIFVWRINYDIKRKVHNIIDIKIHFVYTFLLNNLMIGDKFMNFYIQMYYPSIGPHEAFDLWWTVLVFENIGKKDLLYAVDQNICIKTWLIAKNVYFLGTRLFCNVLIMYKASKNLEFWGYRGQPFPGFYLAPPRAQEVALCVCMSVSLWYFLILQSIDNLNTSCKDLPAYITAVSQQSISSLSAVSQLSLSCL